MEEPTTKIKIENEWKFTLKWLMEFLEFHTFQGAFETIGHIPQAIQSQNVPKPYSKLTSKP